MTPPTTDPDGWTECYSDHEHDIETFDECRMCTSTDAAVVGHVLPAVERVTATDPVEAARLVLTDQTARFFGGVLLDLFTAQAIVAVHDNLQREATRRQLRGMSLVKAASVCMKLVSR